MTVAQKKRAVRWKPIFLLEIYRMTRAGLPDRDICTSLGISPQTLWNWSRDKSELKEALEIARKERAEGETMPAWVYSHLSPTLRAIWDDIGRWEEEKNPIARIEMILSDGGMRVRQQLFLHALCVYGFSPSRAMQKVNITKVELDRWLNEDVDFASLVEEVQWHKGNFFEEKLVNLVAEGNPAAVMFANKTYNSKRGYGVTSKLEVEHSGTVQHNVLDLADLMPYLGEGTRLELLEAIRRKEIEKSPKQLTVTDVLNQQIGDLESEEVP